MTASLEQLRARRDYLRRHVDDAEVLSELVVLVMLIEDLEKTAAK